MNFFHWLANDLRKFPEWARTNPIRFPLLTCFCALLGASIALFVLTGEWWLIPFIMLSAAAASMTIRGSKKIVAVLLAALLFFQGANLNADEPGPQPGPFVYAIIVVAVVGTVVYFALRGFCQKHFPKPPDRNTNSSPYSVTGGSLLRPASVDDDYAATWVFIGWASCIDAAGGEQEGGLPFMMLRLSGSVTRTASGVEWRLSQARLDPSEELVDAAEYERILLVEHGVPTGRSAGEQHFAINGVPCPAWETPIQFSTDDDWRPRVTVAQGAELFDCVMERSSDLVNWQEIGRARVSEGYQLVIDDATREGQMFYRFGGSR